MKYQQLTEGLRYQIACLRDHGLSQARIAKQLWGSSIDYQS